MQWKELSLVSLNTYCEHKSSLIWVYVLPWIIWVRLFPVRCKTFKYFPSMSHKCRNWPPSIRNTLTYMNCNLLAREATVIIVALTLNWHLLCLNFRNGEENPYHVTRRKENSRYPRGWACCCWMDVGTYWSTTQGDIQQLVHAYVKILSTREVCRARMSRKSCSRRGREQL